LAAATAEVLFFFIAAAAGLGHPGVAAVEVEYRRVVPDSLQSLLAHIGEGQVLEVAGLGAGQYVAVGRDGHVDGAPAVHAGLGAAFVVIGDDEEYRQAIAVALTRLLHLILGALQLGVGGHQGVAVEQRPVVIL